MDKHCIYCGKETLIGEHGARYCPCFREDCRAFCPCCGTETVIVRMDIKINDGVKSIFPAYLCESCGYAESQGRNQSACVDVFEKYNL